MPLTRTQRTPRLVHDERSAVPLTLDEILVACPRCRACAVVRPREPGPLRQPFSPRRLVCGRCGLAKDWDGRNWTLGSDYGPPTDPFFQLPLWLQTPCCGRTLWAYNLAHLSYVESYVAADLRQRRWGLASRLPRWLVLRKNRDEVLRAVGRLRERALVG